MFHTLDYNQHYLKMGKIQLKRIEMLKKMLVALLLLTLHLSAYERGSIGLNINNEDLEIEGRTSLANRVNDLRYRDFYIDMNYINGDDSLYGLGFYVENSPMGSKDLLFDIGLRSVFTDSFAAIPIMMGAKIRMYLTNMPPATLGIKLLFAPEPLTFSDGKDYFEGRIETTMQLLQNVEVYLGYRRIETNYSESEDSGWNSYSSSSDNGHKDPYNNSLYGGFRFIF
jgi:hypothetical protein